MEHLLRRGLIALRLADEFGLDAERARLATAFPTEGWRVIQERDESDPAQIDHSSSRRRIS